MLDIPKLGLDLLNRILGRVAENEQDSITFDDATEVLENCRALVEQTPLKAALAATAKGSNDLVRREREVQHSLMESFEVRRMK